MDGEMHGRCSSQRQASGMQDDPRCSNVCEPMQKSADAICELWVRDALAMRPSRSHLHARAQMRGGSARRRGELQVWARSHAGKRSRAARAGRCMGDASKNGVCGGTGRMHRGCKCRRQAAGPWCSC
eukprot:5919644-Pyramimonas_sp.AAC.1